MIKYLLVVFNLLGLLFFKSLFESEPVTAAHNFPQTVSVGNEYVVEVKINKNNISGFAEFRQMLPAGFNATSIDCRGGSFSYSDNEVKIIWMTIPEEPEFLIQYKISVLAPAAGESWVDGSFSYLENNQKSSVNLEKKKVTVNTGSANETAENGIMHKIEMATGSDSSMSLPVNCTRKLSMQSDASKNILVEVEIRNDSVSGFAKLEELIPFGYTASANDVHNAVFSFVDQKVKFLWMSFPFEKEFKVSYLLTPDENAEETDSISGYLSFTLAEVSKKFNLSSTPIAPTKKSVTTGTPDETVEAKSAEKKSSNENAVSMSSLSTDETRIKQSDVAKLEDKKSATTPLTLAEAAKKIDESAEAQSASPLGKPNELTSIPDAQKGISFRVQVCATHKPIELNYFKDTYKINEEVFAEMHEGWHKFTINTVNSYVLARNKREEIKQNNLINGPFVTAYNSGTRITVQEALMIANQKWVR